MLVKQLLRSLKTFTLRQSHVRLPAMDKVSYSLLHLYILPENKEIILTVLWVLTLTLGKMLP